MVTLDEALGRLPKVELHCHVEGTMRPETVVDLARRNDVALPTTDPTELYHYDSLDGFLRVFWLVQSTLTTAADWARLAYESVLDGAAHGVVHREAFFTPARHLASGQDLAHVIAGLDEGIAAAEAETGTTCLMIADIDRAFGPAAGLELVERLAELRRSGATGADRIIGVGMDSTERGIDPVSFHPAFARARATGFRTTAHQGENSPAAAIAACIDVLGVERIDHGLSIVDDPELVRRAVETRIPLTVCPTSNIRIANAFDRLEHHVYPQMRASGLLATLNTDDPALTDLDLTTEYRAVAAAFGWAWSDMVAIALDGVDGCWLDDPDKADLRRSINAAAAALAPEAPDSAAGGGLRPPVAPPPSAG